MKFEELNEKMISAINKLYVNDIDLFSYQTSDPLICERTLSFRLGYYLQDIFRDYNVDCEYNRYFDCVKNIDEDNVYPDIIIHKRKIDTDNLAWIEIKKESNVSNAESDKNRLKKVTSVDRYHYKYGVFIALFKDKSKTYIEYYLSGENKGKYFPFV